MCSATQYASAVAAVDAFLDAMPAAVEPASREIAREAAALRARHGQGWDWILAVNLTGPALACKHAVPHRPAAGGGST